MAYCDGFPIQFTFHIFIIYLMGGYRYNRNHIKNFYLYRAPDSGLPRFAYLDLFF